MLNLEIEDAESRFQKSVFLFERGQLSARYTERNTFLAPYTFDHAVFLQDNNQYLKATLLYKEALVIYRNLAKGDSQTYLPYVADPLNNLAVLQRAKNKYGKAEKFHQEASEIRQKLAKVNPKKHLPDIGMTLNNLAILQYYKNEHNKAEKSYKEALGIRRKLAEINPQKYLSDLAATQINMGIFYQESKVNKELSIQLVYEAITNLLPFYNIPYVQNYLKIALHVLKDWGIENEVFNFKQPLVDRIINSSNKEKNKNISEEDKLPKSKALRNYEANSKEKSKAPNSKLITEKLKAKKGIKIKSKQKGSHSSLSNLESEEGEINIEIDHK